MKSFIIEPCLTGYFVGHKLGFDVLEKIASVRMCFWVAEVFDARIKRGSLPIVRPINLLFLRWSNFSPRQSWPSSTGFLCILTRATLLFVLPLSTAWLCPRLWTEILSFLVACTRLYKPLCPSVRRSVAVHDARDLWRSALLTYLTKVYIPTYHFPVVLAMYRSKKIEEWIF